MDAEDFEYFEGGEREGRILFGRGERREISGTRPSNSQRGTRNWKPYVLPSQSRADVAGTCAPRVKCDPALDRNDHRSRDNIVSTALRRGHTAVANAGADAAPDSGRAGLSRSAGKYRPAGLGEAGRRHHFTTGETATPRWQHYPAARRWGRSFADRGCAPKDSRLAARPWRYHR